MKSAYEKAGDAAIPLFKILLERGANVNMDKEEALYRAVDGGSYEMVQLLLEYGANPNNIRQVMETAYIHEDDDLIRLLESYA